ncbi:glycosyltransferase family 4 protein [Teichococcus vastitatis]|uniref:Glycosyltransferase family 4 protein n=1 Tax=Teichococcus vastitatis TaxID=2307076 RepID=A0ABS9WC64_9PROT|nr:glycosyltransferase family 4 protein [Pseudoroseomonas vastitatis]MCI0756904.1 glycosyltransferase family 4 protein [Pseudoroseomonas vastitatis]
MRLMLWYWGRRGGGAQFALELARALARQREVELSLSLSAQNELLPAFRALGVGCQAVETYRDRRGFALSLPRIPARGRTLAAAARGQDAVISAMTHLWTPLLAPGLRRTGARFVPVVHDAAPHPGDPALLWDWRLRREMQAAAAAVALSDHVSAALRARFPALPQIRMPMPALLGATEPPPLRMGEGPLRLLFFGRMRAYKGLDLLRDSIRHLHAAYPSLSVQLRVVGEGSAESCAPGLSALPGVRVESRWVAEPEILTLLRDTDVVVLPYREASQSGLVSQAQAMGLPVVATPVGGLVEQVRPESGGVVAGAVTPEAFAMALASLADPARRAALRRAALEHGGGADWDGAAAALIDGLRRKGVA